MSLRGQSGKLPPCLQQVFANPVRQPFCCCHATQRPHFRWDDFTANQTTEATLPFVVWRSVTFRTPPPPPGGLPRGGEFRAGGSPRGRVNQGEISVGAHCGQGPRADTFQSLRGGPDVPPLDVGVGGSHVGPPPLATSERSCLTERLFDSWRDYLGLGGLLSSVQVGQVEEERHEEDAHTGIGALGAGAALPTTPRTPAGPRDHFSESAAAAQLRRQGPGEADKRAVGGSPPLCSFCLTNGATERVYGSHDLRDTAGRVSCPVLRAYTCPQCGQSGDVAHTLKYCPLSQGKVLPLHTARNACGPRRRLPPGSRRGPSCHASGLGGHPGPRQGKAGL
ncbi:uncharacterized protein LOC144717541 isoform X1 [Lampetra planeri]